MNPKDREKAAQEAQKFVDENKDALGIYTIRKAFEMGYLTAQAKHDPGEAVAYRIKLGKSWYYIDHLDPFPTEDMEPLYLGEKP